MNPKLITCALVMLTYTLEGQGKIKPQIDSLQYVNDMPYICRNKFTDDQKSVGCGDKIFWSLVKQKEQAIPLLIEKLDDSTLTDANVPNFGYNYTVADIAYVVLGEIIHGIPTFELLNLEFDQESCGFCSYWQHLNEDYQNRKKIKKALQNWYHSNKDNFVWVENNSFSSCDCSGIHPNRGHYELNNHYTKAVKMLKKF